MTGLRGLMFTSATGAKSRLTPSARSSSPVALATARARPVSLVAPIWEAPGKSVMSADILDTRPFSWSVPISSGTFLAPRCRPLVRPTTWPTLFTFCGKRITPPRWYFATTLAGVPAA